MDLRSAMVRSMSRRWVFDVPTSADMSREDLWWLFRHCADRRVVEFGSGGSTVFLASFAAKLDSFETDPEWHRRVQKHLDQMPSKPVKPVRLRRGVVATVDPGAKHGECSITRISEVPRSMPAADVHFVDGRCDWRALWVRRAVEQRAAPVILVHDTRRKEPLASLKFLFDWPLSGQVGSLVLRSNLLCIYIRKEPAKYENWNLTEPKGRIKFDG